MMRSSFAGALARAMRSFDPPLTALDVSLLAGTLTEEAICQLLSGFRRPSLSEIAAIAEALELSAESLLANQRVAGGEEDGR